MDDDQIPQDYGDETRGSVPYEVSPIEITRLLHQEYERTGLAVVEDLLLENKKLKDRVNRDHRVHARLTSMHTLSNKIVESYDDPDGIRGKELQEISGEKVFTTFYSRLNGIREHYSQRNAPPTLESKGEITTTHSFSGPENGGRFLDLNQHYETFVNLKILPEIPDFKKYTQIFANFSYPEAQKLRLKTRYKAYLQFLKDYLEGFYCRINPLVDHTKLLGMISAEFNKQWKNKTLSGWTQSAGSTAEMSANPLFCKACDKEFSKDTVFNSHLKGKKHIKNEKMGMNMSALKNDLQKKSMATLEFSITQYAALLSTTIDSTLKYVEQRQTRNASELKAELEDSSSDPDISSDEEEEVSVANPLNLPIGWDGKPIPVWLYKLHGLNMEFTCEICGGASYFGPRNFERHFKEWRHAYGMRCLGIPNTKHFMYVTGMAEAKALHEKLTRQATVGDWDKETEEEFEDHEGNVFKKKTYEDLRRQGLV